jgi:exodeoxyribonuclease VII large subunit
MKTQEKNLSLFGTEEKVYTIGEFCDFLNTKLKATKAKIVGEVGEAKCGPTGHMYFTLKDSEKGAMLSCIIWASKYRLFGIKLEPGMKIIARGNAEIYAPSGRLSFIADTIELAGEGELKKQYDELKKKLEAEGLFNPENKREIPKYPQKIGVISAKQGAVIHDFLNNIGKFGFKIQFIDSRVEGQGAVEDLLASIKTFRKKDIDVLVIIRGGGSMESLMAFNNELLVREVVGFPVPVVVGIGHDQDVPLLCLAADKSESTPTAVANLLSSSWQQALLLFERYEKTIMATYKEMVYEIKTALKLCLEKCSSGFNNSLSRIKQILINAEKIIATNNPERQLKMGYSIALLKGKVVRKTGDVKSGDNLDIRVSDGIIKSKAE